MVFAQSTHAINANNRNSHRLRGLDDNPSSLSRTIPVLLQQVCPSGDFFRLFLIVVYVDIGIPHI